MGKTQADFRRDINPKDQFGRKWSACIEIATGEPTGGIFPAGWTDPLRTPIKYLIVPRNEDGQAEIGKIKVDFPRWISEQEHDEKGWYDQLYQIALAKNVDIPSDPITLETNKILLGLTGPRPWPSVEAIRLASDGDRRLLGFEPSTKADRIMLRQQTLDDMKGGSSKDPVLPPDNYQDFVGWAFKHGGVSNGDLKKVAELWQDHRKNLQAA